MKIPIYFGFVLLAAAAMAQQPDATPKKDPFADFGHTSLDRKPGKQTPSPFDKTPSSQPAFAPETGTKTGSGIVLAGNWQGHTSESSGGQTMKLADLRALMSGYGQPEADIGAHPDVTIYDGQRMDGKPGDNCRVTYLMPLSQAEAQLFHSSSQGIVTASRAVAPGLPDGLFLRIYDIHAGIYSHLVIVTDNARPEPQVVSMVLKGVGVNYIPDWTVIPREWHTHDYVNTENRGLNTVHIDTRVLDQRQSGHYVVVNTTGRPPTTPPPGVYRPAPWSPKETTTWYVPEPLIKLMLYCVDGQMQQ